MPGPSNGTITITIIWIITIITNVWYVWIITNVWYVTRAPSDPFRVKVV